MKKVVPQSGKVAREARECVQVPFLCFSSLFTHLLNIHTNSFIHIHSYTFAAFRSSFFMAASSGRGSPLGGGGVPSRDSNSGRRTAARHATNWAMPHPSEPCRTLLSHASPCWAMPHLFYVRYRGTLYIMIKTCGIMLLFAGIANIAGRMFVCLLIKTKKESNSVN
jgi:hypothetical protein